LSAVKVFTTAPGTEASVTWKSGKTAAIEPTLAVAIAAIMLAWTNFILNFILRSLVDL